MWLMFGCFATYRCQNEAIVYTLNEEAELGTYVGNIWSAFGNTPVQVRTINYIPIEAESKFSIDLSSGDISVAGRIDRDNLTASNQFNLLVVPQHLSPVNIEVHITDINDNAPVFPQPYVELEIPETITKDYRYPLGTANDPDLDMNSVQDFEIVAGNTNDTFMLDKEPRNNNYYIDLRIKNLAFDYETTPNYLLRIRAFDGGDPPLEGFLTVNISVKDVNNHQPIFDLTKYTATIPENATIGASVVQVFATDRESGDNGRISYSLARRRQADYDFDIDAVTGVLVVSRELDYETEQNYDLIVVAEDHGEPSLESTAVVSVSIGNINDNAPVIDIIYLNEEAPGRISEDAQVGQFIAIISISDADANGDATYEVVLSGDSERFGLTNQDNVMHLVINSLDRESQAVYHLTVTATDDGTPRLSSQRTITLYVSDTNDNPPVFQQTTYHAEIDETAPPGSPVVQVSATDSDLGNNSMVKYRIEDTPESYSNWFQIDTSTGLITTQLRVDCDTQSDPVLTVVAYDAGTPQQSASATVSVHIRDNNDNTPLFEQSFYSVQVREDVEPTSCILTVSRRFVF